jgi:hypothetical protein
MKKNMLGIIIMILFSASDTSSQIPLNDSIVDGFIGKRNANFQFYLDSNSIKFDCSPYYSKHFYVEGIEYNINEHYTYKVIFNNGWIANYPNKNKRDCLNFKGFSRAIVDRIIVIKDMNAIKTYIKNSDEHEGD